jgi:hypothetical protein
VWRKARGQRDSLTASELAALMQPHWPRLSKSDLELHAEHLLHGIYEGIQRGAQICTVESLPDGETEIRHFIIETTPNQRGNGDG